MAALASSTELSCRHRTERGQGAESRHHGTRAFPAHILSSGLKWVRGESPRPLTSWTQQVSGAGLVSPVSPGPRQGQAQNPGPEARCALQGLPPAGWGRGTADLASDPEGLEQFSQEPRAQGMWTQMFLESSFLSTFRKGLLSESRS